MSVFDHFVGFSLKRIEYQMFPWFIPGNFVNGFCYYITIFLYSDLDVNSMMIFTLREKCPNTELLLVRNSPHNSVNLRIPP